MSRVRQKTPLPDTLGTRLRTQRQAVGLTVTQLAQLLGVNRNTIANYERGKTEPSAHDLLRLANALGCEIIDLLAETASPSPPRFALRASCVSRTDPQLTVAVRKYVRAYQEIEDIMDTHLPLCLPQFPIVPGEPHPGRWIEMAADQVRERCGMRDCGPENIAYALERVGIRCLFFQYPGARCDGLSAFQDDMPLVMLRDRAALIERTIFRGAYELGHLVLHPQLYMADDPVGDQKGAYEHEAKQFAGYFLVPTDDLVYIWEAEHLHRLAPVYALLLLKRVFRVSFWCIQHRVEQAGLARVEYPRVVTDVKRLLGVRGRATMANLEPEPLPSDMLQRSTRFARLVYSAFLQGKIGIAKVAECFQISIEEAKERTTAWMVPEHALVE